MTPEDKARLLAVREQLGTIRQFGVCEPPFAEYDFQGTFFTEDIPWLLALVQEQEAAIEHWLEQIQDLRGERHGCSCRE